MIRRAHANGDIYLGKYEGWYCPNEGFRANSDLIEDESGMHCPNHPDVELQWLSENNWFFRLSAYQERLEQYYAEHAEWVAPEYRKNEMLGFIRQGLEDFSVSREGATWGIPFPFLPDGTSAQRDDGSWDPAAGTVYVWYDALINYITGGSLISIPMRVKGPLNDPSVVTMSAAAVGQGSADLDLQWRQEAMPAALSLAEASKLAISDFVVKREGAQDLALEHLKRRNLVADQAPFAIVLGCSDSRVPAEMVFDQGLGDLFVIRVAGNIVAPSQVGSVEFAAAQLGTKLVVVLGHSMCGAILATLDELRQPAAEQSPNLKSIVNFIRPAVEPLAGDDSRSRCHRRPASTEPH